MVTTSNPVSIVTVSLTAVVSSVLESENSSLSTIAFLRDKVVSCVESISP